jgi:citrate lyase beta subunit
MDALTHADPLTRANQEFAREHPGESGRRQPVHVFYGGAHLFRSDSARRMGAIAEKTLTEYAPDAETLAAATGITPRLADTVYARVVEKLRREPIEDLRLDFEDGYGVRPDREEDATADSAAAEVAKGFVEGTLPPFLGIRIKPLNEEMKQRSFRTLDRFLNALLDRTGGLLPQNFVITLAKITVPEQVAALMDALDGHVARKLERCRDIAIEIMVETPQSLFMLAKLIEAARGRCIAAHFGVYDYTASLGITASNQDMLHPVCAFARSMMQASLAGRGVRLSDGGTNLLPVPVHHRIPGGDSLTGRQVAENRAAVHRAWRTHCAHIRNSLYNGFFQSWDLHPAQLVSRYAALYSFFLEEIESSSERLRNFIGKAAQATEVGGVFDDAATGQGLLNFFLRAINCGAIDERDAPALTGLSIEELRSASFAKILEGRRTAV